ncbi:MAG: hypothetical protein K8R21_14390, partial [Leptospira sp.]|nr:hypothetical protein [Leptospira sp.]
MKQIKFIFILTFFANCFASLKGPITPPKPEFTGLYILKDSKRLNSKTEIQKLKFLVITENSRSQLEYYFRMIKRMAFVVSDDREEIQTRKGFVLSSDRELLFQESLMEEWQNLYRGKKEKDPRLWDQKNLGPKVRTNYSEKEPPSGYDRSAEISPDGKMISFRNEIFEKVGAPFTGSIRLRKSNKEETVENSILGIVYNVLPDSGIVTAVISNTVNLEKGMKMFVYSKNKKSEFIIIDVLDEMVLLVSP